MVAAAQETMMTSAHMAKKIIRVSRYGLPCTTLRLTIQRAIYSVIPAALMMLVKAKKKNSSRTVELPKHPQDGGYGGVAAQAQEKQAENAGPEGVVGDQQP